MGIKEMYISITLNRSDDHGHQWNCYEKCTKDKIMESINHLNSCSTANSVLQYETILRQCKTYLKKCIKEEDITLSVVIQSDRGKRFIM